jgi:hypothetical protein
MNAPKTDRLGVAALDYFFSQQGWLFREQPIHDNGIDAHVEIVENSRPTGKLIALQIKSGKSFFVEESDKFVTFRTDDEHIAYWVGHSMPVVLILYDPRGKRAFWQQVSRKTVIRTGKGWKIKVPKNDLFSNGETALADLASLAQPEPYIRRLNRLRIDRRWIDLLHDGVEVRVEFDDWVNKSLPRYQITIYTENETEQWPMLYVPGFGVEAMLEHFFPWAEFRVDDLAHEQGAEEEWMGRCYSSTDPETGEIYCSVPFSEWYRRPAGIVPVSENGETESYVLLLSLNDFGRSFLQVDRYLGDPEAVENIAFKFE